MAKRIIIDLDNSDGEFDRLFAELDRDFAEADYSVPLELVSKEYERWHETLFETQHAPDGTPWPPLAAATIRRKGHEVMLHKTGRLGESLEGRTADSIRDIGPDFMTFGENVPYSIFHQEGIPSRHLPKREHVGLNDAMVELTAEYIGDGAVVALGGVPSEAD